MSSLTGRLDPHPALPPGDTALRRDDSDGRARSHSSLSGPTSVHACHAHKGPSAAPSAPLDLARVRERLTAMRGREYWRSLEELAGSAVFEEFLYREFPSQAAEFTDPLGRRTFLKLMGASLALAGATACTKQPPEAIVPYVRQPEEVVPGRPLFFATALSIGGIAAGILVESHLGRPTKVEGNPDHPASLGATDVFAQASILGLYDPDRAQTITYLGEIRPWSAFLGVARATIDAKKAAGGEGLYFLTGTIVSPTMATQIEDLQRLYPNARWHQYEPLGADNARAGARLAFGDVVSTYYNLEPADVIVSLDADLFACGAMSIKYSREFAARRRPDAPGGMNRLYVVECMPTTTGARADHRLPMRATEVAALAAALARRVGVDWSGAASPGPERDDVARFADVLARDLQAHRGRSAVIAGDWQPPIVHALCHAMNQALGNVGQTVVHIDPIAASPANHLDSLRALVADMDAGRVQTLVMIGGNVAFTAPSDLQFADKLRRLSQDRSKLTVHLATHFDETSALAHWHIPEAHEFESWSDTRTFDGTASVVQPLIAPLYGGKSAHEVLAAFTDRPERTPHDLVRQYWMGAPSGGSVPPAQGRATSEPAQGRSSPPAAQRSTAAPTQPPASAGQRSSPAASPPAAGTAATSPAASAAKAAFERRWRQALHAGVIAGTASAPRTVSARITAAPEEPPGRSGDALEIVFRPEPSIYDGRFANNGWLQELPRPLTKLTWDNAAMMSPSTAERLGVTNEDVVTLGLEGRSVEAPVWIVPGHADEAVTVHLGHGRTRSGRVGTGTGFNAYLLRSTTAMWQARGLTVAKAGRRWPLAVTQRHHLMEGRNFVRAATLDEFKKNPQFAQELEEAPPRTLTLYPDYKYEGYAWGMAIDVNACVGCNACMVACQAENNVPVVGKAQVERAREMHWLRVDAYYRGDIANPEGYFQPVPCMHCENAPCELVCPVAATVHSHEGLNDMVYNRCVGTRYCSNNCPYKVRRFNFLLYQDWTTPTFKMMRNPDVSVRSRGVMEKCTYCVQRINAAKIESQKEDRLVRDGEIATACEGACPTRAIVFGNINDPNSRVAKLRAEARHYALLADLNTRPRTTYLAAIRNPNPELAGTTNRT